MQIEEIIEGAYLESTEIEYKGIIEEGNGVEIGWLKTLAAFANTKGGAMLIGVENKTHKVDALDQKTADRIVLMLHRQIKERIDPMIDYEISSLVVKEGKIPRFVLRVDVKANKDLPVAVHDRGMLGIYVRNFGRTDLATREQIRDLVLLSENTPFDTMFQEEVYSPDDFHKLTETAALRGEEITDKLLISRGIISADGKCSRGLLLFKDACIDPRTKIVMTVWPGLTKGGDVINAAEEYTGNLLGGIECVLAFVRNHSVNGYKKLEDSRTAYYSYPARSVLEGIVNAVGHRNYYIQGSQIEVNIFADRLEITSPGSLPGVRELHEERNISSIIPRRRNDVICAIFEICRYMEERGSGFDKIASDYAHRGEEYQPYVSSDAVSFTLTLPDLTKSGVGAEEETDIPEVYAKAALSGKNDLKILSFCFYKPRTVREIAEYIGVKPSTYFRSNVVARLAEAGLLQEMQTEGKKKLISNKALVFIKQ